MYMMLGRIILMTDGEKLSIVKRTWLTKVFVFGDVASFFTQAAGGGIQASGKKHPSHSSTGQDIILGGLILQVVFFGLFIVTAAAFNLRIHRRPTSKSMRVPWRSHMYALYFTNTLIMIRSVFRAVEYGLGNNDYLLQHEVFLYVFDTILMFIVVITYVWKYPNEIKKVLRADNVDTGMPDHPEAGEEMLIQSVHRIRSLQPC